MQTDKTGYKIIQIGFEKWYFCRKNADFQKKVLTIRLIGVILEVQFVF